MLRVTKGLVTLLVILYSIPMVLWLFLRWWKGESWPIVGFLNAIGLLWFAPLLVLLPVALVVRGREATYMSLLILFPALLLFGPEFLPPLPQAVPEELPRVRVLSYNALISNLDYDGMEAMIREEQPDIIAVQELSIEAATELSARLGEEYPYQLLYPWSDPRGIGMWSRLPLQEGPSWSQGYWERWAQSAVVDVEGHPLFLINLHLWPIGTLDRRQFAQNLSQQHLQAAELQKIVAAAEGAVLVVGDLNASPTNDTYALFDEVLDDVWRSAGIGPGFTWPAYNYFGDWSYPFLRVDYMWVKGEITPVEMQVLSDSRGSDHLPVSGEFALGAAP